MKFLNFKKRFATFSLISAMIFSTLPVQNIGFTNAYAADTVAISGLNSVNQDSAVNFSASKTSDGKMSISNDSATGGFSSTGIKGTSYLLTPNKVSGDFSLEAALKVTNRVNTGTSGIAGIGAFAGNGSNDGLVAAVARGDGSTRSYYQKADSSYGAGSPKGITTVGTSVSLKLERKGGTYTVVIDGQSKDISGLNTSVAGDMYLGFAISGASAEVDSFIIKQGDTVLFDLSKAASTAAQPAATSAATSTPASKPATTSVPAATQVKSGPAPAPVPVVDDFLTGWHATVFGQSVNNTNTITADKANGTVTISAGLKDGSKTGGKITGSHDGISYYYTEVDPSKNFELSADILVNYFAKPTPDKQEAFGIMARDAIGNAGEATVFPSNMVMVGGYRGLIQSVFRNNIKDSSGAGAKMEDVQQFGDRPANDGTSSYKMTMKKTNTGYQVSVDNGKEKIYYRPKQLEVLNKDKVYVGFFTARVASITVSNISFKTSDAATDAPGQPEPEPAVTPAISMTSPSGSAAPDYNLDISSNVKGNLEVKQNGTEICSGPISSDVPFAKSTTLVSGDNTFDAIFTPDSNQNLTSADAVAAQYVVTYKKYGVEGGSVYVSPDGTPDGDGTESSPIDIYSAVKFAGSGQTIYLRGGTYNLTSGVTIGGAFSNTPVVTIQRGNDGTSSSPKVLTAYKGEKPVLDFGNKGTGILLLGDYWKVSGIDVTKSATHGFQVAGNHNVVELVNTYANGDTGFQVSGFSIEKPDKWPSGNLVLNCTSYDNKDIAENNADGFSAKLSCGAGNIFRGCISHNNCDDGWDLYTKSESGPIGAVTIENCIAYGNGTLSDGTKTKGDGNGFKMGGEGIAVKHVLRNCLSFNNNSTGITSNSNPAMIVENCTSVDNGLANFNFATYANAAPQFSAKNNISFRSGNGTADVYKTLESDNNYFYNGTASLNLSGKKISASDFASTTKPESYTRNSDGTIAANDFMALSKTASISGGAKPFDLSDITSTVSGQSNASGLPDGTILLGDKAFDMNYANNLSNITEVTQALAAADRIYVKTFEGLWIDNNTSKVVNINNIPAVTYKDAKGKSVKYKAQDTGIDTSK